MFILGINLQWHIFYLKLYDLDIVSILSEHILHVQEIFHKIGGSTHLAIRQSNKFADRIYGIGKNQAIKNFKIMKRKHNFF